MPPLLLDLSHTSHTRARTGIQRVVRSLRSALGEQALGITFDPYLNDWRPLQSWEIHTLEATTPSTKRGAKWPWSAQFLGHTQRLLRSRDRHLLPTDTAGIVVPELFSPAVAKALPQLFAITRGPRVAVFHDAIALKLPDLTPTKTVARFPGYLRELLMFDGIAAVSEDSRQALIDYWRWLGLTTTPEVRTITLGIDPPESATGSVGVTPPTSALPIVLSVGSIEGRKNHLALLEACERLWANGTKFQLWLIGLAHAQTGAQALQRIAALQAAGRLLRYDGAVDDGAVAAAYDACTFTVYPSLVEGFGLPVIESTSRGKPCICSSRGALGEAARGGGCVSLETVDATNLAAAMDRLLSDPTALRQLSTDAKRRTIKPWGDYVSELSAWMSSLRRC